MDNNAILDFLKKCDNKFKLLPCIKSINNCQSCFDSYYYGNAQDNYSCTKGCLYYAMHYAPAYISEVYHFLEASKILERMGKSLVNIASLGGGMGTDFCAIRYYKASKKINIYGTYVLYDKELQWQQIVSLYSSNLVITNTDLTQSFIYLSNIDIVFINKLFSTLVKNNIADLFLENFLNL